MEKVIQRIVAMLKAPEMELRGAAAKVLGELQPKGDHVLGALEDALSDESVAVRLQLLTALQRYESRSSLKRLLPLLKGEGQFQDRVGEVIASIGPPAIRPLIREYAEADYALKRNIVGTLARVSNADALGFLVHALLDDNFELVKWISQTLASQVSHLPPKERGRLGQRLARFLHDPKAQANVSAGMAALRLLGSLGLEFYRPLVLKFTEPRWPLPLRRTALLALGQLPAPKKESPAVLKRLLGYLEEEDFLNIVKEAIDVLRKFSILPSFSPRLARLLESRWPEVQLYAIEKIGSVATRDNFRRLLAQLTSKDSRIRAACESALKRFPSALGPLLKALEDRRTPPDLLREVVEVLRSRPEKLAPGAAVRMLERGMNFLEKEPERGRAYLGVLRRLAPDTLQKTVLERGRMHRKSGQTKRAEAYLRLLMGTEAFTPEMRYELGLVLLKQGRKRDFSRAGREGDRALSCFAELARTKNVDLIGWIRKEKDVKAADLYYLGFHFSESFGPERQFGVDLLGHLSRKFPKTKDGKSSLEKLKVQSGT